MLPLFLIMNRMISRRRNVCKSIKPIKPEKKTFEEDCCRTCLSSDDLVSIFCDKESHKKRSADLQLVTGLEIRLNDGLSQKICNQCIETIHTALQFRRTSRKSEKALRDGVYGRNKKIFSSASKSIRKQPKIEKTEVEVEFEFDDYNDDYRNNDMYLYSEDVEDIDEKPLSQRKKKHKDILRPKARKRTKDMIPNAASYKCNICGKVFRMKATFKAHMRFHTNYCVCEACGKRCRNNNQLQEHKRAMHGLGRIHKCAYCEYSSATKEALTIHERRHTGERPYVCDHCGATFHRRSNLVQHIAIHLPEKNFQCDMCPKRLKSRKFLQIHKHNAHTGKRYGYLCPVCAHRFEKPNKVRAHTRRVHGLTDEQQGPICPICHKWEKSRKLLQVHEYKRHRETKYRYVCPVCKESFARPGNVRQHLMRTHNVPRDRQGTIERYECRICNKWEKSRKLLQVHIHKRHKERKYRYVCPVCKESFARPENVRRHLIRTHNVPKERQGTIEKYEKNQPGMSSFEGQSITIRENTKTWHVAQTSGSTSDVASQKDSKLHPHNGRGRPV